MYAITFDLNIELLKTNYTGNNYNNAYSEIRRFLESQGFNHQQGSVYFGDETITNITCVLAVQNLSREFPWIKSCVKDIRLLRIEENNDANILL